MNDLFDKDHVRNHPWFKNLKADSAAKEKRIRKHAQSIDLGDSTGKPNLSDMFSSANRLGLLNNSKKLPDLIKTAILTAREVIDQFDFPISPAITYLGVKNVKTAGTTDDVLSGTIVLMCKFATVGGLKQSFDVPVQVVSGKVLPPSVIKFNGRDIVLAQSSVNAMVQRASSYELIPVRKQFSAPLTRDERESATELRNEIGYQAREGIGPVSTIRRTYKKAYVGSISDTAEKIGGEIIEYVHEMMGAAVEETEETNVDWGMIANWIGSKFENLDPVDLVNGLDYYVSFSEKHEGFPTISDQEMTDYFGVDPRQIGVVSDLDKDAESDLTDKITPNEPMADMDDAKKFQNEPLRAKRTQEEKREPYEYDRKVRDPWTKKYYDEHPDQLENAFYTDDDLGEETKKDMKDPDIDLNHWAKCASMGTAIPGGYEKVKELMDKAQDEGKDTFPRSWIHVLRNYILEVVSTASQDAWATHLVNDGYVLNPYGSNNRGREKTAQIVNEEFDPLTDGDDVADEWQDDEPESHIYDGTKTPMEAGDSVKFQGHEGAIRGTIVEVNKADGNAIVKSHGYEYRVALEDIQPLNSTFKKMYANSCIRILPPGKKYAQIFNNMEKDPSIDNPWAATWDARDKDIHSGPKETKNKDVKPIVKGYGKKSVKRPFDKRGQGWQNDPRGDAGTRDSDEVRREQFQEDKLNWQGPKMENSEFVDPFKKMLEESDPYLNLSEEELLKTFIKIDPPTQLGNLLEEYKNKWFSDVEHQPEIQKVLDVLEEVIDRLGLSSTVNYR